MSEQKRRVQQRRAISPQTEMANQAEFEPRSSWIPEVMGILLVLVSILSLFALLGWTQSNFLSGITFLVRQLFGWGAYLFFAGLGAIGLRFLTRGMNIEWGIQPRWLAAGGLLTLIALPLTHLVTNSSLESAYGLGRAGGLLGWVLSKPLITTLSLPLTFLLYILLFIAAVGIAMGITRPEIVRWLVRMSGKLQYWSEQLRTAPDEPVRSFSETTGQSRAFIRPKATQPTVSNIAHPTPTTHSPIHLLDRAPDVKISTIDDERHKQIIEKTLYDFGLDGKVIDTQRGPTITQYGVEPGYIKRFDAKGELVKRQKVRVSQIANLRADLALALAVQRLRIEAPVPGKGIVGIEVPNPNASMVRIRNVMDSAAFLQIQKPLAVALGQDVSGAPIAIDLAKMPHMLIAGTTGSGKSVCMKALLTCLIANNSPETLRLVLIDPKRVEMIRFNGLPHLLGKTEVEGERIIGTLRWVVAEMDRRYAAFSAINARQLSSYNKKAKAAGSKPMPHIVVMIDELADLMVQFGAETERTLCRLAQMARATGIHLVVATQRPSTDIITGLIKANFPARISFSVSSSTDSRVILDSTGADQLLGSGDMLFLSSDAGVPKRIQGCFVSDDEIDRVVDYWQKRYPEMVEEPTPWESLLDRMKVIEETDNEIEQAIDLAKKYDNISTSLIQRRLRVGFPRAARIMETLYEMGLVDDPKAGGKTRKTTVTPKDQDPLGDYLDSS